MSERKPSGRAIALGAGRAAQMGLVSGARAMERGVESLFYWAAAWSMSVALLTAFLNALLFNPEGANGPGSGHVVGPCLIAYRLVVGMGVSGEREAQMGAIDFWIATAAWIALAAPAICFTVGSMIGAARQKNGGDWLSRMRSNQLKLQALARLPSAARRAGPGASAGSLKEELKGAAMACLGNIAAAYGAVVIRACDLIFAALMFGALAGVVAFLYFLILMPLIALAHWASPHGVEAFLVKRKLFPQFGVIWGPTVFILDVMMALVIWMGIIVKKNGSVSASVARLRSKKRELSLRLAELGAPALSKSERRDLARHLSALDLEKTKKPRSGL